MKITVARDTWTGRRGGGREKVAVDRVAARARGGGGGGGGRSGGWGESSVT